jgi:hypothetical protein
VGEQLEQQAERPAPVGAAHHAGHLLAGVGERARATGLELRLCHPAIEREHLLVEQLDEQLLLGAEVRVERAAREARFRGDGVDGRAREAAPQEHLARGVDQRLPRAGLLLGAGGHGRQRRTRRWITPWR